MEEVVTGVRGDQWFLDDNLRKIAVKLKEQNPDELGHIELSKVVFVSVVSTPASDKYFGKCTKLAPSVRTIPYYLAEKFCRGDVEMMESLREFLDIRYVIAIYRDVIATQGGDINKLIEVTLFHELKHIDVGMEKLVDHDLKDFKSIVDKFGTHWNEGNFSNSFDSGIEESS